MDNSTLIITQIKPKQIDIYKQENKLTNLMIINLAKIRFGGSGGGNSPAKPEDSFQETYTANGNYDVVPQAGHVFSGGQIEVDVHPENSLSLTITESGSYTSSDEFSGYSINVDVEGPKPEETLTQTITENGTQTFTPTAGSVFDSAVITVDVPGIIPTGTININANGTYDVTDKATAVVAVGGTDYRYKTGTPDTIGLAAIGWDADSIGYYGANTPHYAWENDNYKVSQKNIDLYNLADPQPSLYKDDPEVTFVPNKNMSTYFGTTSGRKAFYNMKNIRSIPSYDTSHMVNMSQMFYGCSSLETIPLLDTSSIETTIIQPYYNGFESMFDGCSSLISVPPLDVSMSPNLNAMFRGCYKLTSIPQLDTSSAEYMNVMFYGCTSLESIPPLDTSKVKTMSEMFFNCYRLTSIPQLNTSNVTNMYQMFCGCSKLTSIPPLDTSKVTDMQTLFKGCSKLTSIPQLNTSNVTTMYGMLKECSSLTTIPLLDTSKATNMGYMFSDCSKLTTIPQLNTSNAKNMERMFYDCTALASIPVLDTSKATSMDYMFYDCSSLQSVNGIDFSSLTSYPYSFFGYSTLNRLTHFIVSGKINFSWNDNYGFYITPNLDFDSIKSILEAMNRTDNTNAKTMNLNCVVVDREGELAGLVSSCAAKGWTVTGLTLKEQSMINSITPNIDHITKSNFNGEATTNKLSLTIDANEAWKGGGRPQSHAASTLGLDFDYYDATTDEMLRTGYHSNYDTFTVTSGGIGETITGVIVPPGSASQPDPKSGEYALVGITFKSASSPYEYINYYLKVYPDGE